MESDYKSFSCLLEKYLSCFGLFHHKYKNYFPEYMNHINIPDDDPEYLKLKDFKEDNDFKQFVTFFERYIKEKKKKWEIVIENPTPEDLKILGINNKKYQRSKQFFPRITYKYRIDIQMCPSHPISPVYTLLIADNYRFRTQDFEEGNFVPCCTVDKYCYCSICKQNWVKHIDKTALFDIEKKVPNKKNLLLFIKMFTIYMHTSQSTKKKYDEFKKCNSIFETNAAFFKKLFKKYTSSEIFNEIRIISPTPDDLFLFKISDKEYQTSLLALPDIKYKQKNIIQMCYYHPLSPLYTYITTDITFDNEKMQYKHNKYFQSYVYKHYRCQVCYKTWKRRLGVANYKI